MSEWITLTVALAGLALSCLSLSWQLTSFLLSGGRVTATLMQGFRDPAGNVRAIRPVNVPETLSLPPSQAENLAEFLAIRVRNVGRLAVSVTSWHVEFVGHDVRLSFPDQSMNPPMPFLLSPGHARDWYADVDAINYLVAESASLGGRATVTMSVELGTGKLVRADDTLVLHARGPLDASG